MVEKQGKKIAATKEVIIHNSYAHEVITSKLHNSYAPPLSFSPVFYPVHVSKVSRLIKL